MGKDKKLVPKRQPCKNFANKIRKKWQIKPLNLPDKLYQEYKNKIKNLAESSSNLETDVSNEIFMDVTPDTSDYKKTDTLDLHETQNLTDNNSYNLENNINEIFIVVPPDVNAQSMENNLEFMNVDSHGELQQDIGLLNYNNTRIKDNTDIIFDSENVDQNLKDNNVTKFIEEEKYVFSNKISIDVLTKISDFNPDSISSKDKLTKIVEKEKDLLSDKMLINMPNKINEVQTDFIPSTDKLTKIVEKGKDLSNETSINVPTKINEIQTDFISNADKLLKIVEEEKNLANKMSVDVPTTTNEIKTDIISTKNKFKKIVKVKKDICTKKIPIDVPIKINEFKADFVSSENELKKVVDDKKDILHQISIQVPKKIQIDIISNKTKVCKTEKIDENKKDLAIDLIEVKSLNKLDLKEKNHPLIKLLSINLDNTYSIQYDCLTLNKMIDEFVEKQNNISKKLVKLEHFTTNFSYRHFLNRLNSAKRQLGMILKLINIQSFTLMDLQSKFHQILLTVSSFNHPDIEAKKLQCLSSSLKVKENNIKILQKKNDFLEQQLQNFKKRFLNIKKFNKTNDKAKNKRILQLQKKLSIAKNRIRMIGNKKNIEKCNIQPSQIQQLQNLTMLTTSLMLNIASQMQNSSSANEHICQNENYVVDELKDGNGVDVLKNEIKNLKEQSRNKDDQIKKLIKEKNSSNKQLEIEQKKRQEESKQKDFEIELLKSTIKSLEQREDRWLTDRFHLQCHSMMLLDKLRQSELSSQNLIDRKSKQK